MDEHQSTQQDDPRNGVMHLRIATVLVVLVWVVLAGRWVQGEARFDPNQPVYVIDMNHADAQALKLLPGIGDQLAARIIQSRQSDGPFTSLGDLRRVRGIGERLSQRWEPYVTVSTAVH